MDGQEHCDAGTGAGAGTGTSHAAGKLRDKRRSKKQLKACAQAVQGEAEAGASTGDAPGVATKGCEEGAGPDCNEGAGGGTGKLRDKRRSKKQLKACAQAVQGEAEAGASTGDAPGVATKGCEEGAGPDCNEGAGGGTGKLRDKRRSKKQLKACAQVVEGGAEAGDMKAPNRDSVAVRDGKPKGEGRKGKKSATEAGIDVNADGKADGVQLCTADSGSHKLKSTQHGNIGQGQSDERCNEAAPEANEKEEEDGIEGNRENYFIGIAMPEAYQRIVQQMEMYVMLERLGSAELGVQPLHARAQCPSSVLASNGPLCLLSPYAWQIHVQLAGMPQAAHLCVCVCVCVAFLVLF